MKPTIEAVKKYYNETAAQEWERIAGRPEFIITCRYMDRYIAPREKVLDIGGGPGRYSIRLAEKGCDVFLMDLAEENVGFAKKTAEKKGLKLRAVCGNACEADRLISENFDHILLMGPMYHLLDEEDRVRAVDASLKLLKPGGTIFVSFINAIAGMIFAMREDPEMILSRESSEKTYMKCAAENKIYSGDAFTKAVFTPQDQIVPFMERFPLDTLHLFGQESLLSPCENKILSGSKESIEAWLDWAEGVAEDVRFLSWAEHLMYVGRYNPKLNIV